MRLLTLALMAAACGAHHPASQGPAIARTAASWVGGRGGPGEDCADLARAAWRTHGALIPDGSLFAQFSAAGRLRAGAPLPGDLLFFRDPGAEPSAAPIHAGVVERAEDDGTVVIVHRLRSGVTRLRMNLSHPGTLRDPRTGKRWNDVLQAGRERRTVAQLYAARAPSQVTAARPPAPPPRWPSPWPGPALLP